MNGLSWLIYFAGVASNIGFVCGAIVILGGLALGVSALVWATSYEAHEAKSRTAAGVVLKRLTPIVIIAAIVGTLTPTKDALMLIAASEVGESVLSTDAAKNIGGEAGELATDSLKLLRKYITEQLGEDKTEDKKP